VTRHWDDGTHGTPPQGQGRLTPTTAGFSVSVRGRRVYLIDVEHHRDPGMSHHEAKELAQRLWHAAAAAERNQRRTP